MSEALQYFYDAEADVLSVSKGEPRADVDSDEVGEGVVARFDPITRRFAEAGYVALAPDLY